MARRWIRTQCSSQPRQSSREWQWESCCNPESCSFCCSRRASWCCSNEHDFRLDKLLTILFWMKWDFLFHLPFANWHVNAIDIEEIGFFGFRLVNSLYTHLMSETLFFYSFTGVKATYLLAVAFLEIIRFSSNGGILNGGTVVTTSRSAFSCAFEYLKTPNLMPAVLQCLTAIVHRAFETAVSWLVCLCFL